MTAEIAPVLSSSLMIPKSALTAGEMDELRRQLTFRKKGDGRFGFGDVQSTIFLFDDSGNWFSVPRAFGLSAMRNFRSLCGLTYIDRTSPGEPVEFTFNEELQRQKPDLKKEQDRLVGEVVKKFKNGINGGILYAPCGTGKTVMACKIASQIGVTTLILAHKEFLVGQWRQQIARWLNISEDEVGIVQQDRCDYYGKKIVVAMIQSLVERKYDSGLYSWPGLVIADETHRHGAELWHKSAMLFTSKYRLGLTATPDRKDGMWPIVRYNFGEILAHSEGEAMNPTIYAVKHNPSLNVRQYCWVKAVGFGEYKVKKVYLGKLVTLLAEDPSRNAMITGIIMKAVREGRKVLLLTDRLSQIAILKKMILAKDKTVTVGRYVGGMSEDARDVSAQCQVILATFQMAQEGLDIPTVDVGILATPHADVEQAVGRTLRHMENKKDPVIVDIVDNEPHACIPFFRKRERLFESKCWPIRYIA